MSELATVNAEGPYAMSIVHLNGWVTMTGIDAAGSESAPAEPVYVGWRYFGRLDVNSRGDVFAADSTVQRIDGAGVVHPVPLRSAGGYWPATAVAVGSKDELLVLSRDSAGVCVFGLDGREQACFGTKGAGDGQLDQPSDLDLDAAGNVYVADTNNNRIVVFGPDGAFVANAGAGKIEKPVAVEVDGSGNLYVIKIPKAADGYGEPVAFVETQAQPWDVTSDASGRIYIAQDAEPGLLVVGADGGTLAAPSKWGEQNLRGLSGLAFDRRGVLVCSMRNLGVVFRVPLDELVKAPQ
jgi:DNA-binding beta-propeller fold protein YncE